MRPARSGFVCLCVSKGRFVSSGRHSDAVGLARSRSERVDRSALGDDEPTRAVQTPLTLDPDVLEAYRQEGPGWQALMNDALRQHMPRQGK